MKPIEKMSPEEREALRNRVLQSPKSPVTVFHHIPKCGGTSILNALSNWFVMMPDYGSGWTGYYPEKANLDILRSAMCLCGHYELDGNHLHQRYPEVFSSDRFRVITFIRDPLQVKLSLYRYEKENNVSKHDDIEEHLLSRTNYIAHRLPATIDDYKEIIDRYLYVGILEEGQACLNDLAKLLNKPRVMLPWNNSTGKNRDTEIENISDACLKKFREKNKLDYLIYDYCANKIRQSNQ